MKTVVVIRCHFRRRGETLARGPAPQLGPISQKAKLTGPPVAKIVETEAGRYVAPWIRVEKKGSSKVVDVTPLGRQMAGRIRAGTLPR